ncbi:hypothetical protein AACH10_08170 [Ideonella sp. DXS22W]|uniref:Serine hydrolase n=1 Tax=Pseudaquabacterium inlustre TaxID=2984192 RepID=A0ABU9CEU0_9BURK
MDFRRLSAEPLTHATLAEALRQALVEELAVAPRFDPTPQLDLAVIAFPEQAPPVWANVLWGCQWPQGLVASIDAHQAGPVRNIAWFADPTDAQRNSIAWAPGADCTRLAGLPALAGDGPHQAIAPYPASLIKLMVAVGVAHLVDRGLADWHEPWTHAGISRSVAEWAEPMITVSSNEATSALVALLHARGLIRRAADGSEHNGLHALFERSGLATLRLARTRPDGGWLNRDGAGVGHLQMTAWDTARLLWCLLPGTWAEAPAAPWRPADAAPLLSRASAARLWGWLGDQALHQVLSSTLVAGLPGWQPGIPAELPARWLQADGSARTGSGDDERYPPDIRPAQRAAQLRFAHKTGTTASYVSDAGWVTPMAMAGRRYLIALIATLGNRHAPHPQAATPWCVPRIGARVDAWLMARLG